MIAKVILLVNVDGNNPEESHPWTTTSDDESQASSKSTDINPAGNNIALKLFIKFTV